MVVGEGDTVVDFAELFEAALKLNPVALEKFFENLLPAEVIVYEKDERVKTDGVDHPALLNILALPSTDEESTACVPCFLQEEEAKDWIAAPISLRKMSFSELIRRIPAHWSVSLNPDSDLGKDFTAWELDRLREGKESFAELIDELCSNESAPTVGVQELALDDPEYADVVQELRALKDVEEIHTLYFFKKVDEDGNGEYVVAATLADHHGAPEKCLAVRDSIEQRLAPLTIGLERFHYLASANDEQNPELLLLKFVNPLWNR